MNRPLLALGIFLFACEPVIAHPDSGSGGGAGGGIVGGGSGGGIVGGGSGGGIAPPPPDRVYDLDGNGTAETDLAIGQCSGAAGSVCLLISSTLTLPAQITLTTGTDNCGGAASVYGRRIHDIGSYAGTPLHEVSAVSCPGAHARLDVIDVAAGSIIATNVAPGSGAVFSYTDAPSRADGKRQPFLGAALESAPYSWGSLCVFRYGATDPGCGGNHFVRAAVNPTFTTMTFTAYREAGGYLQDLDGDGWEDINLYFAGAVHTLSGQSLAPISTTEFNVSAATANLPSVPWFHGGRNYGLTTATTSGGVQRSVQVAGTFVGAFANYNCGVSRFVSVLASTSNAPASRALAWSQYFSFASTFFSSVSPAPMVIARQPDVLNQCVHIPNDALTVTDGIPAIVFNRFNQTAPIDTCQALQYAATAVGAGNAEFTAFYNCFQKNAGLGGSPSAQGQWTTVFLRQDTGAAITGGVGYVWGYSSRILPSGQIAYLIEFPQAGARFNLSQEPARQIAVSTVVNGLYVQQGLFPRAARPRILTEQPYGAHGSGGGDLVPSLSLQDRDRDGLLDVQLEDGSWVGWSAATSAFVAKP